MQGIAIRCVLLCAAGTSLAFAATNPDTVFSGALDQVHAWMTGWLGKTLAASSLVIGMGVAVATQSQVARLTSMVIALAFALGPGIIESVFSATL